MQTSSSREVNVEKPNESGFSKTTVRIEDIYQEGIVDSKGNEIVKPRSNLLVNDITGTLALLQVDRKFIFVPLDQGPVSLEEIDEAVGFQYAEPYQCGFAKVCIDDVWFYIDVNGEKAFGLDFEFAESFHNDRALVMEIKWYRIIDTQGKTVADLPYDQVNSQSPWCWQVTTIEQSKYLSGFVDLNGNQITDLIYTEVGYYDPIVKRIRVTQGELHGFLDEHAKVVIPVVYEHVEAFHRGIARVTLNGRTFFINPDGIEVPE